jgi:hypothetical protein
MNIISEFVASHTMIFSVSVVILGLCYFDEAPLAPDVCGIVLVVCESSWIWVSDIQQ